MCGLDAAPYDGAAQQVGVRIVSPDRRGMVEEYRAWVRPWGFDPEHVRDPVTVCTATPTSWCP